MQTTQERPSRRGGEALYKFFIYFILILLVLTILVPVA